MKTLFFTTMLLLLYSCRTVQKVSEDQYAVAKSYQVSAGNSSEIQSQEAARVKYSQMSAISRTGNGFDRWIEEQVMEYSTPGKDSAVTGNTSSGKVVQIRRTIRERGKQKAIIFQQSASRDSLREQESTASAQEFQTGNLEDLTLVQKRRLTKRTGIPWYIWAGGGAGITLGFWLKKRYQLRRAHPFQMDER
ncbi:hypothetical protein [Pseudoflavitalea rhizosphaerae]|uniref:hypothetical protein n=1 Tax=Pseudoflavitalea rhizosphaerae TaxID=1884793 RepID=UPI000F8F6514|nr:hypothetical protein [Pseudoflavitalea rhizosphaerae]